MALTESVYGAWLVALGRYQEAEPYLIERVTSRDGRLMQEHLPRARKAMAGAWGGYPQGVAPGWNAPPPVLRST